MKAIVSKNVVVEGCVRDGALLFDDGKIIDVVNRGDIPPDAALTDVGALMVLPGVVDSHVHINEPGRTEWEGFNSATQAAAAGGITTVIDMPLNCIPVTTTLAAFHEKLNSLRGKLWIDCGFHGGVVPGNASELEPMVRAGIRSFKAFMIDSGINEFGFVRQSDLEAAMPILAKNKATLLVHAEVEEHAHKHNVKSAGRHSYQTFLATRPGSMEVKAIEQIIALSRQTGCRVHIVHLSSADALPIIHEAKRSGVPISAETCPHYLTIVAERIPDGDGRYKCMPPIRGRDNCERLWSGLLAGDIEMIVSDHSPCTPALKRLEEKNLADAWGGISSLQFGLSLIWTAMRERKLDISYLTKWLCSEPARIAGFADRKGQLKKGLDADFVVFDPDASFSISKDQIYHRHKETPYEGRVCYGRVHSTWVRGRCVFANGQFQGTPSGAALL